MADFFKIGQASYSGSNPSKAIGAGLQAAQKTFMQFLGEKKEKERAYNIDKAKKLGAFGENYNPNALDGENRAVMDKFLRESRMEYANLIDQTRNLNPSSEEYINALTKANQIKSGFNETLQNTLEFSKLGAEYIKASQDGKVSSGMAKEDIAIFDKIWIDKDYELVRDSASGQLSYKVDGQIIPKEKLDDWRITNNQFPKQFVTNYNESAYKVGITSGKKITPQDYEYKQLEFGITQDLNDMPIEEIRSLFLDKTMGKAPLIISSPGEDLFSLTKEELIDKARGGLMKTILDTNQKGASEYKPKTETRQLTALEIKERKLIDFYNNTSKSVGPLLNSYLSSPKTLKDTTSLFTRLGLNIKSQVTDEDNNVIAYNVEHPTVGETVQVNLDDPELAAIGLSNALGASKLGVTFPVTQSQPATSTTAATSQQEPEQITIPGTFEEEQYPENFDGLSTELVENSDSQKDMLYSVFTKLLGVPKYKINKSQLNQVKREITRDYGGEFSEKNVSKAVFDVIGREKVNKEAAANFEKSTKEEENLSVIRTTSDATLSRQQRINLDNIDEIVEFTNKRGIELTAQDVAIYNYAKQFGKSFKEVKAELSDSDLEIIED